MQTIHTRIYELGALIAGPDETEEDRTCREYAQSLIGRMKEAPHFFVGLDVADLVNHETSCTAIRETFRAMNAAGVCRLPFPITLVESVSDDRRARCFTLLMDVADKEIPNGMPGKVVAFGLPILMFGDHPTAGPYRLIRSPHRVITTLMEPCGRLRTIQSALDGTTGKITDPAERQRVQFAMEAMTLGVVASLLMTVTDGIERQEVTARDLAPLNRARARRGKAAIPQHSVIRIGAVYDHRGRRHAVAGQSGRHVAAHLRAGHVRRQPCGPGRREVKRVFIRATLVNVRPADEAPPPPPRRLVKV